MVEEEAKPEEAKTPTAAEMKAENDALEAELKRREVLRAQMLLGGKTDAGIQPEKPKEETAQEYSKRILGQR